MRLAPCIAPTGWQLIFAAGTLTIGRLTTGGAVERAPGSHQTAITGAMSNEQS
jgi:hypothetical protein